jgi:hypothetical protein
VGTADRHEQQQADDERVGEAEDDHEGDAR